jgi:Tfp pilus assembly protein PilO
MGLALQPREQQLASVAAALIGCWALLSWLIHPLWDEVREQHVRVQTQTDKLEALRRILAQAPEVEQRYQELAGYLEAGDDEAAQRSFLSDLEALAQETGTRLNLKPRSVTREERVSRLEIELDAEGTQQQLLRFLDGLLQMPKLIAIERLRLAGMPAKPDLLRATLVIHKLTLHQ